jgi:hypothetical protein
MKYLKSDFSKLKYYLQKNIPLYQVTAKLLTHTDDLKGCSFQYTLNSDGNPVSVDITITPLFMDAAVPVTDLCRSVLIGVYSTDGYVCEQFWNAFDSIGCLSIILNAFEDITTQFETDSNTVYSCYKGTNAVLIEKAVSLYFNGYSDLSVDA